VLGFGIPADLAFATATGHCHLTTQSLTKACVAFVKLVKAVRGWLRGLPRLPHPRSGNGGDTAGQREGGLGGATEDRRAIPQHDGNADADTSVCLDSAFQLPSSLPLPIGHCNLMTQPLTKACVAFVKLTKFSILILENAKHV
jgi:hypothetical protein